MRRRRRRFSSPATAYTTDYVHYKVYDHWVRGTRHGATQKWHPHFVMLKIRIFISAQSTVVVIGISAGSFVDPFPPPPPPSLLLPHKRHLPKVTSHFANFRFGKFSASIFVLVSFRWFSYFRESDADAQTTETRIKNEKFSYPLVHTPTLDGAQCSMRHLTMPRFILYIFWFAAQM